MADFPSLHPDRRSYRLGQFIGSAVEWADGTVTRHRFSENPTGMVLTLEWDHLQTADRQAIEDHWHGQQGGELSFDLPAAVWCGNTLAGNFDTATTTWRWAQRPEVEDGAAGTARVRVTLVGTEESVTALGLSPEVSEPPALEADVASAYVVANRIPDPTSTVSERMAGPPSVEWDEFMLIEPITYATEFSASGVIRKWEDYFGSPRFGNSTQTTSGSIVNPANYAQSFGPLQSGRWEMRGPVGDPPVLRDLGFSGRIGTWIVRVKPNVITFRDPVEADYGELLAFAGNGAVWLQMMSDGNVYAGMYEAYNDLYDDYVYGSAYVYNDENIVSATRPYVLGEWHTIVMRWKEYDMSTATPGSIYLSVNGSVTQVPMPYRNNFPNTGEFFTGRFTGGRIDAVGFYWADTWVPDWRVNEITAQMEAII